MLTNTHKRNKGSVSPHQNNKQPSKTTVDILALTLEDPLSCLKTYTMPDAKGVIACDILIIGGGVGGIAAAYRACSFGLKVCLTEETDWPGGQMTSQGVSALDENYLVESSGANKQYQDFRRAIRAYYKNNAKVNPKYALNPLFNPGNCWVSRLSFEPKVAVSAIEEMLAPFVSSGHLQIFYRLKPLASQVIRKRVAAVSMIHLDKGHWLEFHPSICLDATEFGDLLPLTKTKYSIGSESSADTKEPHAPDGAEPDNVQDFVYPFVVEFCPTENHTINQPALYSHFKDQRKFSFFQYKMFAPTQQQSTNGTSIEFQPFWSYRRLIDKDSFAVSSFRFDLAMINWMSNDLRGMNVIDKAPQIAAERLALAKSLSLSFLYWLQTEAPRDEGGFGYPELRLRPDVMGTEDGLSKFPYIRESRRLIAHQRIVEQDIAAATNPGARAKEFHDSIGIGFYPIDIHGKDENSGAAQATRPFQIPLGALITNSPANLIAAGKSIGTTHITNGAYRLHPIEWAIGEAAGTLASHMLLTKSSATKIWRSKRLLHQLQLELVKLGVPIYWYDDVPTEHKAFASIQFLAITRFFAGIDSHLHFFPDKPITRSEVARVLHNLVSTRHSNISVTIADLVDDDPRSLTIASCIERQLLTLNSHGKFCPDEAFSTSDLEILSKHKLINQKYRKETDRVVTRAEFANFICPLFIKKLRLKSYLP